MAGAEIWRSKFSALASRQSENMPLFSGLKSDITFPKFTNVARQWSWIVRSINVLQLPAAIGFCRFSNWHPFDTSRSLDRGTLCASATIPANVGERSKSSSWPSAWGEKRKKSIYVIESRVTEESDTETDMPTAQDSQHCYRSVNSPCSQSAHRTTATLWICRRWWNSFASTSGKLKSTRSQTRQRVNRSRESVLF